MKYHIKIRTGLLLFLTLYCMAMPLFAQTGKKRYKPNSQLVLSGYVGFIFNNININNNDVCPGPFKAPAAFTFNPKITLDFQRTTRYRMMYGFGIEYGTERQDFDVVYNSFDFIDTSFGFRNGSASKSFRNQSRYLGARFAIGYLYPVKTKNRNLFDLEAKLTVTKRFMTNGGQVSYSLAGDRISNDTLYARWYDVMKLSGLWGNRNVPNGGLLFTELHVGARKDIDWIKNDVYFGIYGSWKTFFFRKNFEDVYITNGHYLNGELQYYDTDYYTGTDFILGLKLGIGLKL